MTDAALPDEGWPRSSYLAKIRWSVVAFIRDHGPVSRDRVLTLIVRAGLGGDVKKASSYFDEADGADRILNFLLADVAEITVAPDGTLSVPPDVRQVQARITGDTVQVPSADDLVTRADQARRRAQLRSWLRNRPFENEWKTAIRQWSPEQVTAMAGHISEMGGYFGPPIVRDQDGIVLDGHLRALALDLLGIDPIRHTVTRTFDGDLDRLAWILNAHARPGDKQMYPTTLRDAVVKMVDHGKPQRAGPKRGGWLSMDWPEEIALMLGGDRRDLGDDESPPELGTPRASSAVPEFVTDPVASPPPTPAKTWPMSGMRRTVARVLERHGSMNDEEVAAVLAETGHHCSASQSVSPRFLELRVMGWAEQAPEKRGGHAVHSITAAGLTVLNKPFRPAISNNTPGQSFTGERGLIATRLVSAARAEAFVPRRSLTTGVTDVDRVLRRTMWFSHEGRSWLFLPDTLAEDWSTATAVELSLAEETMLRTAGEDRRNGEAIHEVYEELWRRHSRIPS